MYFHFSKLYLSIFFARSKIDVFVQSLLLFLGRKKRRVKLDLHPNSGPVVFLEGSLLPLFPLISFILLLTSSVFEIFFSSEVQKMTTVILNPKGTKLYSHIFFSFYSSSSSSSSSFLSSFFSSSSPEHEYINQYRIVNRALFLISPPSLFPLVFLSAKWRRSRKGV